jgi:hypothetical protein
MDKTTRDVVQAYIKGDLPFFTGDTVNDDEAVPLLLMVLGRKLDTLIELMMEKNGSVGL